MSEQRRARGAAGPGTASRSLARSNDKNKKTHRMLKARTLISRSKSVRAAQPIKGSVAGSLFEDDAPAPAGAGPPFAPPALLPPTAILSKFFLAREKLPSQGSNAFPALPPLGTEQAPAPARCRVVGLSRRGTKRGRGETESVVDIRGGGKGQNVAMVRTGACVAPRSWSCRVLVMVAGVGRTIDGLCATTKPP